MELASRLASRRAEGPQQTDVVAAAAAERQRLLALYAARPPAERPAAWFTYHLYYKAPDWLGPEIARALAIPDPGRRGLRRRQARRGALRLGP